MNHSRTSAATRSQRDLAIMLLGLVIFSLSAIRTFAADAAAQAQPIDFQREVWPLLEARCISCHGPEKQKGKLRLDARAIVLDKGGVSGPVLSPGKPDHSLLYLRAAGLVDGEDAMPPEGKPLSKAELATLHAWIKQGAIWPDNIGAKDGTIKTHWAPIPKRIASSKSSIAPTPPPLFSLAPRSPALSATITSTTPSHRTSTTSSTHSSTAPKLNPNAKAPPRFSSSARACRFQWRVMAPLNDWS